MNLSRIQRYGLSILSGILLTLSFPFTGSLYVLGFIAWIPLLFVEEDIYEKKEKSKKVLLYAYITFLLYNVGSTFWIYLSKGGEVAAIVAYLLNSFIMAIVFLFFHRLKRRVGRRMGQFSLIIFWIGLEYIHFNWELSWPWITLGNIFSVAPQFVQWYSITGALGGTFWLLMVNLILFFALYRFFFVKEGKKKLIYLFTGGILLIILPGLFSYIDYINYKATSNPIEVVVTQPNIDPYHTKFSTTVISQLKEFVPEAERLISDSTVIVLAPETAIPAPFLEGEYTRSSGVRFLMKHIENWGNTALLVGASTQKIFNQYQSPASRPISGTDKYFENYNTAMLLQSDSLPQFIHKSKLVLGVEKMPFLKWLPFLKKLSVENGGTSGTLGVEKEPRVLEVNGVTFAPVICYGSIYGDFVAKQCKKGAQAIFIITNDGWWGNSPAYKQHASFARLRAIETRRYVVQSANTGISCIINERGDVIKATDYWVKTAFRSTINLNNKKTFYVQYGDLIGQLATLLFFILLAFMIVLSFIKNRSRKTENKMRGINPPA